MTAVGNTVRGLAEVGGGQQAGSGGAEAITSNAHKPARMVWLHADPRPDASMGMWLVSPLPQPCLPGQGSAPSGAPSHTTSSACWPSKWEMTSLAVASLVMSPCGRAAGEQGC